MVLMVTWGRACLATMTLGTGHGVRVMTRAVVHSLLDMDTRMGLGPQVMYSGWEQEKAGRAMVV